MARISRYISVNSYYIICEGKTEKNYFEILKQKLRISGLNIICIVSEKKDPKSISEKAIEILEKNKAENNYIKGDKYYCVFDLDNHRNKKLDEAKKEIIDYPEIKLILSNPSLELWFLLHFEKIEEKNLSNRRINDLLSKKINKKYSKSHIKEITKNLLIPKIKTAIKNSKKIEEELNIKDINLFSEESNPSTMLHILIEEILESNNKRRLFY
ncbi:MAG: RloB family protein [Nanoarchaeota archaeon]